jgi:regulation of enolase protein 1 (concanavalin A-like superfamily)
MSRHCLAFALVACFCAALAAQEEKALIKGWGKFVDPDKDCSAKVQDGKLVISVPGKDHDLGVERNQMTAPRVLREVEGDFIIQVRVSGEFRPGDAATTERAPFNGAGILLMKDEQTYLRIERATFHRDGNTYVYASWELRRNGEVERFANASDLPLDEGKDTFLRLERRSDKIHAAVSQERDKWHYLEPKTVALPGKVHIGVAAVNTSTRVFAPRFDEIKLFRDVGE